MSDPPGEHDLMDAIKQWREREFGLDHLPPYQAKRRQEIVRQWILRRGLAAARLREPIDPGLSEFRPTERELRDYCLAIASAPDLIASEDALMTYFLAPIWSTGWSTTIGISPRHGMRLPTFWAGSEARLGARIKSSAATRDGPAGRAKGK